MAFYCNSFWDGTSGGPNTNCAAGEDQHEDNPDRTAPPAGTARLLK